MGVLDLARAAASPLVRSRPPSPPDAVLSETAVRADPERLRGYARVCGFPPASVMPPTYPHVLAFALVMRLMTRRDFPFVLPGLIHIRNVISVHRPIGAGEALSLRVHAADMAAHPKGRTVDVVSSASAHGTECWTERSTYLHRAKTPRVPWKTPKRADAARDADPTRGAVVQDEGLSANAARELPVVATWDLPADTGRRYAQASGDWNPIHLSPLTARLLGFRRPIAHGMWTLGRTLAALPLPDSFTVEATFVSPLVLPSRVEFATDGEQLAVRPVAGPDSRPHLTCTVTQQ